MHRKDAASRSAAEIGSRTLLLLDDRSNLQQHLCKLLDAHAEISYVPCWVVVLQLHAPQCEIRHTALAGARPGASTNSGAVAHAGIEATQA